MMHAGQRPNESAGEERSRPAGNRRQRVLWCGPSDGEFHWLLQRINRGDWQVVLGAPPLSPLADPDWKALRERLTTDSTDRLIIACRHRWDYPPAVIGQLLREFPEVPLAVAVSDWWQGWKRSGVGHQSSLSHLCLPWYRWWDGWQQWLGDGQPTMMGPYPSERPAGEPSGPGPMPLCVGGNLILCAGFAAGQYRQCLGSEGNRPTQVYVGAIEALRTAVDQRVLSEPQFILWDDSRLPTQRGPEVASEFAMWELNQLARRFPAARLGVAWTRPSWYQVHKLLEAAREFELLAKPCYGLLFSSAALARM